MHKVNFKPKSVNRRSTIKYYNGQPRIAKTDSYKKYCHDLFYVLPRLDQDFSGRLKLTLAVGLSNPDMDSDNTVKAIQDAMQQRYKFNDSKMYLHNVIKIDVEKGKEFFAFRIDQVPEFEYQELVENLYTEFVDTGN